MAHAFVMARLTVHTEAKGRVLKLHVGAQIHRSRSAFHTCPDLEKRDRDVLGEVLRVGGQADHEAVLVKPSQFLQLGHIGS